MRKRLLSLCLLGVMTLSGTSAWALDQKDGVYQINSLEDYLAFASLVNTPADEGGNPAANAVLNADIDLGTNSTMIGTQAPDYYQGTFDGQGHTITVNAYPTEEGYGLFRRLQKTAEVRNLRTNVTVTTSKRWATGLAYYSEGAYIHNCYVECTVNSSYPGDATHAGIVADAQRATFVADCFVKFTMNGTETINCGGILGWSNNYTTVQNCVVINETNMKNLSGSGTISRNPDNLQGVDVEKYAQGERPGGASYGNFATAKWDNVKYVTITTKDSLKLGAICYELNNDQSKITWTQEIGKDEYPLPAPFGSGKQVYASQPTDCHGHVAEGAKVTYSNTAGSATCDKHSVDKFGVCVNCGYFDYSLMPRDDKEHKFLLSSAKDFWLAEGQNRIARGTFYDMKMEADVTLEADSALIFNNDNWYAGTFDGQGHALTLNITQAPSETSLFPRLQGTVKNLSMHGSIDGASNYYASVASTTQASTAQILNVYSDINITTSKAGDATNGGLVSRTSTKATITNCIYNGKLVGTNGTTNCAGLVGWCTSTAYLTNCAFTGEIVDITDNTYSIARNPVNLITDNVYYINKYVPEGADITNAIQKDASVVGSGELAFLLNGKRAGYEGGFYQTIGVDNAPYTVSLNHGKIYPQASSFNCDGTGNGTVTYANTPSSNPVPPHTHKNGFCAVCGALQLDYITPTEDGWYELKDGHALAWWSVYAATVDLGAKARLTADVTMDDEDNAHYAAIGTELKPYYGSFDGQFHRISNLKVNFDGQFGAGLISVMNSEPKASGDDGKAREKDPVFIRDVILDKTCSLTGKGYVGIIGMTAPWGGNILVQNVGMEGDVRATEGANAGGVLGCVMSSSCKITIDNSFMAGSVFGVKENGSFSGWLGSYATISNCYAIGEVENPEGLVNDDNGNPKPADQQTSDRYFARYGTAKITNCFARYGGELKQDNVVVVAKVSDEDVLSGALAFRANGNTSVDPKWYQNLEGDVDEHPMPVPTHGTVFKLAEKYMSVSNEDELQAVVEAIQDDAHNYDEITMAEQTLKDAYNEAAQELANLADVAEVAKAYEGVLAKKSLADASAKKYKTYVDEMAKVQAYLKEHLDFEGEEREVLEAYFESTEEPNDVYPLGGYMYITEEMQAPSDSLANEVVRVNAALQEAIKYGYIAGTNVSGLFTNADFLKGKEGWEGSKDIGVTTYTIEDKQIAGAERWAGDLDMTQTVEGLKPGWYKVEVTGAARPSDATYGLNYIATLDANGTTNYFMADIEDPISYDDAIDQVNSNIHGATSDRAIYEDGVSTTPEEGGDTVGFVMHGQLSVACVINGGTRYKNYTMGYVGEDGKLTIRLRQDKSGYGNDWFGFGNVVVTYCGEAETGQTAAALDDVLNGQKDRANTILGEAYQDAVQGESEYYRRNPNFPVELRTALSAAVNEAEDAGNSEAKIAAMQKLSELFLQFRDAKQAYADLACAAEVISEAAGKVGEEIDTNESYSIMNVCAVVLDGYFSGSYSTEEAKSMDDLKTPETTPFIPETRGDTLLLASRKQYAYFVAHVKYSDNAAYAELTNDIPNIDEPLTVGTFYGTLDGKFHSLNMNLERIGANNAAPIDALYGTVKNLVVKGNITTDSKYAAGVAAHAYANSRVEGVTSSVNINSSVVGDGTHGGLIAVVESGDVNIRNCVFDGTMTGEATNSCGGLVGWLSGKANIYYCLQIGDIQVGTSGGHTWARTGTDSNRVLGWCAYLNGYGDTAADKTTAEKLASGEVCYWLTRGETENPAWFQTLGVDTVPHVTPGATVYYYNGEYINEKPNIQLNSYASSVNMKSDADNVEVTYTLNAPAQEGEIRFYNSAKEVVYTETLATSDLTTGSHSVTVSNSSLPAAGTELTFDVKIKGYGSLDPARVGEVQKAWWPYGMAVMNDPESASFGNIYVTETNTDNAWKINDEVSTGYISDIKRSGLYMFNPLFKVVNAADGTPGWKGGMTDGEKVVAVDSYTNADYKVVRTTQDGRLFVGRMSGKTDSPIFEVNPDNMEEAWTPVFTGTIDKETGITYAGNEEQARLNVSFDFAGKGDDMQLLTLGVARSDGGFNYSDYKANIYNLGKAKQWDKAADITFEPLTGQYTIAPMPVSILSDQRGGAWYFQYRGTPSALQPAIKHINAQGEEDYSDITTNLNNGGAAISPDGSTVAVSRNGSISVYKTDYEVMPNGLINLMPIANFTHKESNISAMAFDYAGNLIVGATGSHTIARYVIPSQTDNVTITPASSRCTFKVGEIKTGIEQIAGESGDGRIYNLQGVQLQKAQKGVNIINGKKVMVK